MHQKKESLRDCSFCSSQEIKEGNGSRIRFDHKIADATFHEPYLFPETPKSTIDSIRKYLINIGVKIDFKI